MYALEYRIMFMTISIKFNFSELSSLYNSMKTNVLTIPVDIINGQNFPKKEIPLPRGIKST